ncbi:hypothetical protein RQP46_002346 [Phenoliferia psychrophenolica]
MNPSSTGYPSPSPASPTPTFPSSHTYDQLPPQPDERRRSKRDSTSSASRREDAAQRYPSPPLPASSPAPFTIPPFNPNNRRAPAAPAPGPARSHPAEGDNVQLQAPARIPAQHQTTHRPASTAVIPVQHSSASYASQQQEQLLQQQRARQSVGYLPTHSAPASSAGPYPNIYSPHAMPRQKIYFGPYILLQTLGEGEFGKVKLGVHSERWGEEVAIKLIKRGSVDTAQRTEKVRREIDVLKAVRHPNIVRLYDVIETEKYIGIVLEYASGGELFDHILAHRYLKERDASRLFAQLISGVAYLHAKKIVHRDLKLENLLLDRNRNVIITDFGFANRFELAADDLMATSCGSPCYAAPELVVQEGKYVGTAVDVWSCGVILYAMLAGYLPYDDDPANPEGDNINLLYKYIINTPLSFPDWISPEPRELLLMMLVPDPLKRCTVEDVMRHSFLRKYMATFTKSVADLEAQAQEAELFKRQALEAQRQFLIQQQQQQQQLAAGGFSQSQAQAMGRSQSNQSSVAQKHRSAAVTSSSRHMMETSNLPPMVPEEAQPTSSRPMAPPTTRRQNSNASPPQTYPVSVDADPFSYDARPSPLPASIAMIPSFSAPATAPAGAVDQIMAEGERRGESRRRQDSDDAAQPSPSSRSRRSSTKHTGSSSASSVTEAERRKKQQHRATVQVEYDGGESRAKGKGRAAASTPDIAETPASEDVEMTPVEAEPQPTVNHRSTASDSSVEASLAAMALSSPEAPSFSSFPVEPTAPTRSPTPPLVPIPFPSTPPQMPASPSGVATPNKRKNTGSPTDAAKQAAAALSASTLARADLEATPRAQRTSPPHTNPAQDLPAIPVSPATTTTASEPPRPPSVASTVSVSKHKKGPLSTDRFSFRGLLGSSSTSLERTPSAASAAQKAAADKVALDAKRVADQQALDEVTNNRRKSRRQKALSMGGFSRAPTPAKLSKAPKLDSVQQSPASRTRSSTITQQANGGSPGAGANSTAARPSTGMPAPRPPTMSLMARPSPPHSSGSSTRPEFDATWGSNTSGGPTPQGKAKQVMDWFRRKGPKGDSTVPFQTDFDRHRRPSSTQAEAPSSTPASTREGSTTPIPAVQVPTPPVAQPSVIVTASDEPAGSVPSSRSASGAQSDFSHTTVSTVATSTAGPSPTLPTQAFVESRLRFHVGALDKSALTQRSPQVVISEIRNALWGMGIDMLQEGDFKLKCVRKSRKKLSAITGLGLTTGATHPATSGGAANATSPPSALDRRSNLPGSPSTSTLAASPSSGFRSFFGRKGSATQIDTFSAQSSPGMPSPALSIHEGFDLLSSPMPGHSSQFGHIAPQPLPAYGDSNDSGGEVRFYCEITRVTGLAGMYCIDMRRVKGELFSYRFVYTTLLAQLSL